MNRTTLLCGAACLFIFALIYEMDGHFTASMVLMWMGLATRSE